MLHSLCETIVNNYIPFQFHNIQNTSSDKVCNNFKHLLGLGCFNILMPSKKKMVSAFYGVGGIYSSFTKNSGQKITLLRHSICYVRVSTDFHRGYQRNFYEVDLSISMGFQGETFHQIYRWNT